MMDILLSQKKWPFRKKNCLGLTLVELIIAISLSAIIMGACAVCMSLVVKAWGESRSVNTSELVQARIVSVLQRDIASAVLLNDTLFDGNSSRMTFSRLSQISFPDYGVITIPCKVEWFRNSEGHLIRKESTITSIAALEYKNESDFGECPVFLLSYAGIPLNTTTPKPNPLIALSISPTYEWQSNWSGYHYYPAAVNVQLDNYQFLSRVMVYSSPDSQATQEKEAENE